MFNEKFNDVLAHEGVVAIVSCANNEAHVVNTWNSYLRKSGEDKLLIPAFGMRKTEKNVTENPQILLTLGSKEVMGYKTMGTGFLVSGTAKYLASGPEFDLMKASYSWANRVLEVTVTSVKQTI